MAISQISLFFHAAVGLYTTAVMVVILGGVAMSHPRSSYTVLSAMIIPVAILVTLVLPSGTVFTQTTALYEAILVPSLVYHSMFQATNSLSYNWPAIRRHMTCLPLVLVIGQVLGASGFGLLRHQYLFAHTSLPLVAIVSIAFALAEEILLRGLVQQQAARIVHPLMAAVLSSILSMLLTIGHHGSWLTPLFGLLAGSSLAALYYKKQNLALNIVMNATIKLTYVGLMAGFIFRP